ncbi:MAG: hypothetical protein WA766_11795 [Candidatus Acidiferrales bacterium]
MAIKKAPYVKGTHGTKPTPAAIPDKPVNFEITQNAGLFPAQKSPASKKK